MNIENFNDNKIFINMINQFNELEFEQYLRIELIKQLDRIGYLNNIKRLLDMEYQKAEISALEICNNALRGIKAELLSEFHIEKKDCSINYGNMSENDRAEIDRRFNSKDFIENTITLNTIGIKRKLYIIESFITEFTEPENKVIEGNNIEVDTVPHWITELTDKLKDYFDSDNLKRFKDFLRGNEVKEPIYFGGKKSDIALLLHTLTLNHFPKERLENYKFYYLNKNKNSFIPLGNITGIVSKINNPNIENKASNFIKSIVETL